MTTPAARPSWLGIALDALRRLDLRSKPQWRRRSVWDPEVNDITTAVGRRLPLLTRRGGWVSEQVSHIVGTDPLERKDGYDTCTEALFALERAMASLLADMPGLRTFRGLRRLSRRLYLTSARNPTENASRLVAEIATHKYARWGTLEGLHYEAWTDDEFDRLAKLFALAETYADFAAIRRRIGKGQSFTVLDFGTARFSPTNSDVEELITRRDMRTSRERNAAAAFGRYASARFSDNDPRVLGANWRPLAEFRGNVRRRVKIWQGGPRLPAHDLLAEIGPVGGLFEFVKLEHLVAHDFERHYDIGLAPVMAALFLLSWNAAQSMADLWVAETCYRYGYIVCDKPNQDVVSQYTEMVRIMVPELAQDDLDRGQTFLDSNGRDHELDNPVDLPPVRFLAGHKYVYDFLWSVQFAQGVARNMIYSDPTGNELRRGLEGDAQEAVSPYGVQAFGAGQLIRLDGVDLTDLDAHVVIGSTMYVLDCYSSPFTSDLDRGVHGVTRNRAEDLRRKLQRWDAKWERAVTRWDDLRPTMPPVMRVRPLIITSGVEYIDTLDDYMWINEGIPRCCTLDEALEIVDEHPENMTGDLAVDVPW